MRTHPNWFGRTGYPPALKPVVKGNPAEENEKVSFFLRI